MARIRDGAEAFAQTFLADVDPLGLPGLRRRSFRHSDQIASPQGVRPFNDRKERLR